MMCVVETGDQPVYEPILFKLGFLTLQGCLTTEYEPSLKVIRYGYKSHPWPERNYLITRRQKLACLTCAPNEVRTHRT